MDLDKLNTKIERNKFYIFTQRHKKVILVIQGLFIIGLLIGINTFVVKDYFIKQQIAERCGYTTSQYKCICEKNYVDNWEEMERGNYDIINVVDEVINNWSVDDVDS